MRYTLEQLTRLRESEDKVEFKAAEHNFSFAGSEHRDQNDRRKCYLGYIVALSNERGGTMVLGMTDDHPHLVVGSDFADGAIGNLEDEVYNRLNIRVHIEEIFNDDGLRVVVTYIPSRPIGRIMKFEGVGLMRTGDSLRNMSDDESLSILTEQEEDFTSKVCSSLTLEDLDREALKILKAKYSEKQRNKAFLNQSDEQVLIDLDLQRNGQLTYAALILLGKSDKIYEYLPQCTINLEYRDNPNSIQFDKRDQFSGPYFITLDELWKMIEARNKFKHIQVDSYIIDIPELNDEVIRESINNAVAHRDYTKSSEIVIKHSKEEFSISSHGGFPLGVTLDNILTINSTPRNRLLAEVLTKAGLVERSGQGVDKIFYQNLTEGKAFPTYIDSDPFQVTLRIPTIVLHPVFALFIKDLQNNLSADNKLGVHEIITLSKIRGSEELNRNDQRTISKLKSANAIIDGNKGVFLLSKRYNELIRSLEGSDRNKIISFIKEKETVKMGEIVTLFKNRLTRRQVNNLVYKMVEEGILKQIGKGKSTVYKLI